MAFTATTFQYGRGITTCPSNGKGVSTAMHGYKNTTDSYTTITTSGYFPNSIDGSTEKVFVGDTIMIVASDTVGLVQITGLAPFTVGANLLGTAGSPIVMSTPAAALDANGIKISGTTVQMEIADATHPGIVTQFDQAFSGMKAFMSGAQFLTAGGTPTTLNYYEQYTHATTFTLGSQTSGSVNILFTRIGNAITLFSGTQVTTPGQGTPGTDYVANTALPARFIPNASVTGFWQVVNGGILSAGIIFIDAGTGRIHFFNNVNTTTGFTTSQINGFLGGSISYISS